MDTACAERPDPFSLDRLAMKLAIDYGASPAAPRDSEQYADGWIAIIKATREFDASRGVPFAAFAAILIRNAIRRGKRHRKFRERPMSFTDLAAATDAPGATDPVDRRSINLDHVRRADDRLDADALLSMLDERARRFAEMNYIEGWTHEAIGTAEPVPVTRQAVNYVIHKGFAKIRATIKAKGGAC